MLIHHFLFSVFSLFCQCIQLVYNREDLINDLPYLDKILLPDIAE